MTEYKQTTVRISSETKKKIRLLAAELGIPMGTAALQLIEIGLNEYAKKQRDMVGPDAPLFNGTGAVPVMEAQA